MSKDDTIYIDLLASLIEIDGVRETAIVDDQGEIWQSRGDSKAIKSMASDPDRELGTEEAGVEDVYVEALGDGYLLVAFELDREVEEIREKIERRRADLGV